MTDTIEDIERRIHQLQRKLAEEMDARRARFQYELHGARVEFPEEVKQMHRKLRRDFKSFVKGARPLVLLSAPVIYSVIIALVILDIFVSFYHFICFPIYGIPKVRRRDYIALDRHHLQYLNGMEKLNCVYCGYANGLLAYAAEVASRTEQFWCPIKHARRLRATHPRYPHFFDYGDAVAYREKLPEMRKSIRDEENAP